MVQFGTAGIRGPVADRVTPALALAVGQAVGTLARTEPVGSDETTESHAAPRVVIGRDGRVTGSALMAAAEAGVAAAGATPVRVGMVPTPTLAFASQGRYGIILTASHNPPADNGIKLFVDGSEFDSDREKRVEAAVDADESRADWQAWQVTHEADPLSAYRAKVVDYAREVVPETADGENPWADVRVAVDCGNGMAALATPQVLRELGAEIVALNANVDGFFPGRPSKPTPETIGDLRRFVADSTVDFGIAHDGDADRIVLVDSAGTVVHEDTVLAILAAFYTRTSSIATDETPVVVTTPNASGRIDEQVAAAGGRIERVRLGALHEAVSSLTAAGERVVFAAEPWKHLHPAFGGWIDGVVSAALFSGLIGREELDPLREPIAERPYRKVSITCTDDKKSAAMATLETTLPAAFPESTASLEHGVRLTRPDSSWLLVRPSGTEPYIRLYAESDAVDELVARATERIDTAIDEA